jgi:hypothetical protein
MRWRGSQSMLEYAIFLAIIMCALLVMQVYVKRGYQGRLKQDSDSISGQHYDSSSSTSLSFLNTSVETESYTGGSTYEGGLAGDTERDIPPGTTVSYTNSSTSFKRAERMQ